MRRRLAAAALAGVAVLAVGGCGERDGAAPSSPAAPTAVPSVAVDAAAAADVASAVDEAEKLLSSIDAELAQDDAEAG